jgi:hypothetical protein
MIRRASLVVACLFAAGPSVAAQDIPPENARPSVTAIRLGPDEAITLDGRFDEPAWRRALPATDFKQQIPQNGAPPTERTEVRFLYSRDTLYMGVTCFDDEPDKLLGNTMKRDEGLRSDDRFIWEFDTFLDARNGYYFEMNPSGLMADALLTTQGQIRDWDGIWNAHVRRSEIGWTIEIELPFRTFNFDPNAEAWGVNFQRTVRRKNEESFWTGWGLNQGMRIQYTGLLLGIRDVSQGHGLELRPYGVTSALASPGRGRTETKTDAGAGIDAYYSVTPALRANVTVNTDFAQTEVDQRQVNLTQYSLFFPEKRGFFLEGASYFDFASFEQNGVVNRNLAVVPFFTRRIGLDTNGDPQKIDLGLKLTGQAGRQDIGLMQIRTAREDGTPGEDFTALRVRRNIFRQSYVGALFTRRDARTRESAIPLVAPLSTFDALSTFGADFRLGTTTFHGNQNIHLTGYYLTTTNPLKQGKNGAWGANFEYPNDRYIGRFNYREVQENYDPAVGFTLRNGYRRYAPQARFQPRPRRVQGRTRFGVQQYQFGVSGDLQYLTAGNDPLLRQWDFTVFQADFQSQEQIQFHVIPTYERLDRNFTISRGVTLPIGTDYNYSRYRLQVRTADYRTFAVTSNYETGSFYSGDRDQVSFDVGVRPRRGVVLYLYGEWNKIALPQGRFTTRLYRAILDTQFNPWVSLSNTIQYDSVSAVMGWQSRFRWILTPGSDFYIVYNHNWLDDPLQRRFTTLDRRASSKLLYTYRF